MRDSHNLHAVSDLAEHDEKRESAEEVSARVGEVRGGASAHVASAERLAHAIEEARPRGLCRAGLAYGPNRPALVTLAQGRV